MRFVAVTAALLACSALAAQEVAPAPRLPEVKTKKAPRIWTNDDLENLTGRINVVGDKSGPAEKAGTPAVLKEKEEESCESDAWTAAVAAVLRPQGVPYSEGYWSERLFGGLCQENVPVAAVAARLDGDYVLDDGRKLHLKATAAPGLPPAAQIVGLVKENRTFIVRWKNQPLVMTKVDYINHEYNYISQYAVSTLMFTNALTRRVFIFDIKANSDKEIADNLQVTVEGSRGQ